MKLKLNFIVILSCLLLANCASRSQTGSVVTSAAATAGCLQYTQDPVTTAACAVTGAFVGADAFYNDDVDLHAAVFVDHMNNGPSRTAYTNWYNKKTGNSGTVQITRSYTEGPFKCKDYNSTVDITQQWPVVGYGHVQRSVSFGTACQMPDGRWIEKSEVKNVR